MSHDTAHAAAVIIAASTTVLAAAPTQALLSDLQILMISVSCGAIGGVVATLMSEEVITPRGMWMRGLASVLIAPGLVAGLLIWSQYDPRLLFVASAAGVAGMLAWPVATQLNRIVQAVTKYAIGRLGK
jgi:hypothetical protein